VVRLRGALLRWPYGEQGLLIARRQYDKVGGYRPLPWLEDADLVRRLGTRRVKLLSARAVSSAARYRRDGYVRHALDNQRRRLLYMLHLAPKSGAALRGER